MDDERGHEDSSHYESRIKYFQFSEPYSITGTTTQLLSNAGETTLATITLHHIRSNDRVVILASVGWQISATASITNPEIRFRIHRDGVPGTTVFDTIDSGSGLGRRFTTSLTHAETNISHGEHQYTLTAFIATGAAGDIAVTDPINLDGFVIDENESH